MTNLILPQCGACIIHLEITNRLACIDRCIYNSAAINQYCALIIQNSKRNGKSIALHVMLTPAHPD